MIRVVVVFALVAGACSKTPSTGSPELDRFEKEHDGTHFDGAYVSASGVFIHRKLAIPPDKLTTPGALRAVIGASPPRFVVFDIDDQPAKVARTLLLDLDGLETTIGHRDPKPGRTSTGLDDYCQIAFQRQHHDLTLSVDILPDRVYAGVTPALEFHDIRDRDDALDLDRLDETLKELRAGQFSERFDLELAIDDHRKSKDLVLTIIDACNIGFNQIAILSHDQLTAKTTPNEVVDLAGLATAADVIAKLRAREGKDYFDARAGKDEICDSMRVVASIKHPHKPKPGTGYFVARVHANGGAWIAMVQAFDPKDPTTEFRTQHLEAEPGALRGELNNMRLFTNVKTAPLELAADDRVDGATFLAAIRAACEGRTQDFDLRRPGELSIVPGQP